MLRNHKVRRVTKRTYDQYNRFDYSHLPDNLNPVNPTQLESQYDEIVGAIQKRIVEAYEKAKVTPPAELFDPATSPATLLNDVNALMGKIKGNPLSGLYDDLGNFDTLASFVGDPDKTDSIIRYPPKLNCSDIESTLKASKVDLSKISLAEAQAMLDVDNTGEGSDTTTNSSNSNSLLSTDSNSDDEDVGKDPIHITYVGLEKTEDMSKYPETVLETECPVTLERPTESPNNMFFGGWFYDELYNQKLANNTLDWPGRDITIYAYFKDTESDDNDNDTNVLDNSLDLSGAVDDNNCDLIELAFLKIILIIVIVSKVLIDVLVLVVTILKTAAEVVKEAQLCWINPPMLTSLIGYVMQRLGAIIFQILGMVLLKLWAMLNTDCISRNTVNTIAQINAALAGITDLIGSVDSLAINFSDNSADLWNSVKESIKTMKDQLKDQAEKVWEDMGKVGDQLKQAGKDIADTYTNPATYLAAVPPEIRNTVTEDINAFNDLKQNITNLQSTINNITNRNGKIQNETPPGVETIVFSN